MSEGGALGSDLPVDVLGLQLLVRPQFGSAQILTAQVPFRAVRCLGELHKLADLFLVLGCIPSRTQAAPRAVPRPFGSTRPSDSSVL